MINVYFGAEYLGYLASALSLATVVTAGSLVVGVAMALLMAGPICRPRTTLRC